MATVVSDEDFIAAWEQSGGRAARVAKYFGLEVRGVYSRRKSLEQKYGKNMPSAGDSTWNRGDAGTASYSYQPWLELTNFSGSMVIFSDCHWWPGVSDTPSYRALLSIIKEIKPKIVIGNGDLLDGARISRHRPLGWEGRPKLPAELEEVRERMAEIRHSCRASRCIRTVGNHDARFERWLAEHAPELEGLLGTRLIDHLPAWEETIAIRVNGLECIIKHMWHGGVHTAYNNTLKSGTTFVTGHTHELEIKPYTDYRGTRYGIQTGTLAALDGPQFSYADNNPTRGREGFVVLSFAANGKLLNPELCEKFDGKMYFRGKKV